MWPKNGIVKFEQVTCKKKVVGTMALSTCSGCELTFSSLGSFDKHRVGNYEKHERRCLTEDEMIAIKMRKSKLGYWTSGGDFDMGKAFSKKEGMKV